MRRQCVGFVQCHLLLSSVRRRVRASFSFSRPSQVVTTTPACFSSTSNLFGNEVPSADDGPGPSPRAPSSQLSISIGTSDEDALFLERFKRRRTEVWPSSNYSDPQSVVTSTLASLRRPHEPAPYFGYDVLYARSTSRWQDVLRRSVGAPRGTKDSSVVRALGASMERTNNQFGLLVGAETEHRDSDKAKSAGSAKEYTIEFPYETVDYFDGTAWLECRLRDKFSGALLAALGWSMEQRSENGSDGGSSWRIDGLDWQDFREEYRPGIGREEWERICG